MLIWKDINTCAIELESALTRAFTVLAVSSADSDAATNSANMARVAASLAQHNLRGWHVSCSFVADAVDGGDDLCAPLDMVLVQGKVADTLDAVDACSVMEVRFDCAQKCVLASVKAALCSVAGSIVGAGVVDVGRLVALIKDL